MTTWTSEDIPSLQGRSAVVTGTGGLGYESALALARAGASVIVAGRDPYKGAQTITRIAQQVPNARVRFVAVDLANLLSVRQFSHHLHNELDSLDILINNAGVMMPSSRTLTRDGFELQLGTNYLGHFALTAQLLPILRKSPSARIISLSSLAARQGTINFTDLQAEHHYRAAGAYSQSKLACLIFAIELQRRSTAGKWGISSIAVHPGIARTELLANGPGNMSILGVMSKALWFLFQSPAQGALPTLFAATSPQAQGGHYYGPDKIGEIKGYPALAKIPANAQDAKIAMRLWKISEQLTQTSFASVDS